MSLFDLILFIGHHLAHFLSFAGPPKADKQPAKDVEHAGHGYGEPEADKDSDSIDSDTLEEEGLERYHLGGFHPVRIGEVYDSRYEVLRKIGWGQYSTVWMVREQKDRKLYAMKVLSAACYGGDKDIYEREILRHLRSADRYHLGHGYINHLVDDFEHRGPNGNHVCLVFELMGETLSSYPSWFPPNHMLPKYVMKGITVQLLLALMYAHENGVIHSGSCAIRESKLPRNRLISRRYQARQYLCQNQGSVSARGGILAIDGVSCPASGSKRGLPDCPDHVSSDCLLPDV